MTEPAKIDFRYGRARKIGDVVDLVEILFPGNRNQQHAAARIMLALRAHGAPLAAFADLERRYDISRRTMERTRAKLARLGVIERISWMHRRYDGHAGWVLTGRMSAGLRRLADQIERWCKDRRGNRQEKEEALAELLRPAVVSRS